MNKLHGYQRNIKGKVEYLIGWLVGIPIPILVLIYLIRN